jgi:DNA-binding MarR family transcriptional regulator
VERPTSRQRISLECCTDEWCKSERSVQLTEREAEVCEIIHGSDEPVSFGDLRKDTGFHQEIVSRIVRRLSAHGLVRKTPKGYLPEVSQ